MTQRPPVYYADVWPKHPDYGLPDAYRQEILRDAEALGAAKAAELHRVSARIIYAWRRARNLARQ